MFYVWDRIVRIAKIIVKFDELLALIKSFLDREE